MGLWDSTKLTGVKLRLQGGDVFSRASATAEGELELTASRAQRIVRIRVALVESFARAAYDRSRTEDVVLGQFEVVAAFELAAGESRLVPFRFSFAPPDHREGNALGWLVAGGNGPPAIHKLVATVEIPDTLVDASVERIVRLAGGAA